MESLYASLIRAGVTEDDAAFDRILDEIELTNAPAEFLGAAFHVALRRRFATRDPAAVIRFVGEMRTESDRTGEDIDPAAAERAIQCVLDGREPEIPFDADELAEIECLVIVKILRDTDLSEARLDQFFAECDVVLNEYVNSGP